MQELNEESFVARLRSGDREAFDILFRQITPRLANFLRKWFDIDVRDAEEIAADTLVKVHHNVATFDPHRGAKLTTWIFKIGRNATIDFLRKAAKTQQEITIDEDLSSKLARASIQEVQRLGNRTTVGGEEDPETESQRLQQRMSEALASLRDEDRDLILMRQVMDYDQIAAVLNLPVGTLRVRYLRAISRLRTTYEKGDRR